MGLELLVGDDSASGHGRVLWRGRVDQGEEEACRDVGCFSGYKQKPANHEAINIHATLRPFYWCTGKEIRGKNIHGGENPKFGECGTIYPTLSGRGLLEGFVVVHAKASTAGSRSIFHVDSNGDESTG